MIKHMEKIHNSADLKIKIKMLEAQQIYHWDLLQNEIAQFQNNLKPLQLIKNAFADNYASSSMKKEFIGTAVGLTAGLAAKAIAGGFSHNPIKKIIAAIFQLRITNAISQEPGLVNKFVNGLIGIFKK